MKVKTLLLLGITSGALLLIMGGIKQAYAGDLLISAGNGQLEEVLKGAASTQTADDESTTQAVIIEPSAG